MPRIRTIKPEFWTDGNMVGLTPWARLFYIGTWNFALCDQGHLPDDAMGLKLRILPADQVDADELVSELVSSGRIVRRRLPDGRAYLLIRRFADHQKLDARWSPKCPYCAAEPQGFVDVASPPAVAPPDSPEPHRGPPEHAETRASQDEDGSSAGQAASDRDGDQTPPKLADTHPNSQKDRTGKDRKGQDIVGQGERSTHPRAHARDRPPPTDAEPSTTERLIAEYVSTCKRPPPSKETSRLASEIHALLADGFDPDEVRDGITAWRGRRLGAGALPAVINELANGTHTGGRPGTDIALPNGRDSPTRQSTRDRKVAATLALAGNPGIGSEDRR